jgi:protein-disulfide isomerase
MKSKFLFLFFFIFLYPSPLLIAATDEVAAQVGDHAITQAALNEEAKEGIAQIESQIYDVKRQALNRMIEKSLLDLEAKSQGLTVETLSAKIKSTAKPVTDADIQQYYDANKARFKQEFTQVKPQISSFLKAQAEQVVWQLALQEYRKKYPVKIHLKAPRISVVIPKDAIARGPENAPVKIVFYTDFQCPFCKRGADVLTQVLQSYPGKVQIIYRDYPLDFHPNAMPAAQAAHCAAEQNSFWPYHDVLFANQNALDSASLKKYAAGLTLNTQAFDECLDSGRYKKIVEEAAAEGARYGVRGTPGFFINGRPIRGALPFEAFREIIDEELTISAG